MKDSTLKKYFHIKFLLLLFILCSQSSYLLAKDIIMGSTSSPVSVSSGDYFYVRTYGNGKYANNKDYTTVLESPAGTIIRVVFERFDVESHATCGWDWLKAFVGNSTSEINLIGKYCGSTNPSPIASTGNSLTFQFHSDGAARNSGWKAKIEVLNTGGYPDANCKDITVQLDAAGNASISAVDVNNGSSDVETSLANLILSIDKATFDCDDIGTNDVELSVEDEDGNVSTCTATVTVEDNVAPSLLNLNAEYYTGTNFGELKYSESVAEINTNWVYSSPNVSLVGNDNFSIFYNGSFVVPETGDYTFYTNSDDGVRLIIDGSYLIENWGNHGPTINNGTRNLSQGEHTIMLQYYENTGGAVIELEWESANVGISKQVFSKSSVLNNTTIERTLTLNASGNATLTATDVDPGFIDNCGVTSRSLSQSTFTSSDIGVNTVVLTVKDASGNSTNFNVKVTVEENVGPSTEPIEINTQDASIGSSPEDLVQNVLVTGCLMADTIEFKGNSSQIGYFNKGDSDFPLSDGIILSTGNVADAVGSNDASNTSTGFDGSGDSDLNGIATLSTNDAAVLEFDFKPAGDVLQFRYVFASEEYSEYVCASFNDVFGFFLSGPGIGDGSEAQAVNIALLDDGATPVSINNVHGYKRQNTSWHQVDDVDGYYTRFNGTRYHYEVVWDDDNSCPPENSHLYVDNNSVERTVYQSGKVRYVYHTEGGYDIEYDGRTVILTATYTNINPCEWYHIKLAVGDVGDDAFDSSVFLEAKSFKSNEVQVDNMIGTIEGNQDIMYEGCDGSFMRFIRNEDYDINEEVNFAINIAGTANNEAGVSQDYVYTNAGGTVIGDGVFPTTITIPSGDEYVDYHYKALDEGAIENDETIIFRIDRCPCDGSEYYEKTVTIISAPKVDAVASAAIQCVGAGNPTATISVQLIDGISSANYLYSFDGGLTFGGDNVKSIVSAQSDGSDLVGQTFNIVVKDLFSCSANIVNLTTTIPAIQSIDANAGGDKSICFGLGTQLFGGGGIFYEWTCSTPGIINYLSDPNVSNPLVYSDIPIGTYVFTLKVQDQAGALPICSDQENMTLTIKRTPVINSVTAGDYELCSEEGTTLQANVDMTVSYLWNPSSGLSDATIANPAFSALVGSEESRSYSLTVEASNGCSAVANLDNAITVYPNPSISLLPTSNLCSDGSNGEIRIEVSGGTPADAEPKYSYSWSPGVGSNSANATGLSSGSYSVTVTDEKSCAVTGIYSVGEEPVTKGIYHE